MPKLGTKAQVARGAAYLDEKFPDWAKKINKKTIRMESNRFCILGQLAASKGYKGKDIALSFAEDINLSEDKQGTHGFECTHSSIEENNAQADFWRAEIDKRLPSKPSKKANGELNTKKAVPKKVILKKTASKKKV